MRVTFLQHCIINSVVYTVGGLVYLVVHHFEFESAFIIGAVFVRTLGREADNLIKAKKQGSSFWDWIHS